MKEILTRKRCGILLVSSCCVYFLLNIFWLAQGLVPALSGAFASTIAFGLFIYFIRVVVKEKEKLACVKKMKKKDFGAGGK
ncbi:MAG: hypothetical protein ACFFDN_24925 [Candidatus Hodarchaeota archaeon]